MSAELLDTEANAADAGPTPSDERSIVFFDGVCGICNAFVDFAMPRDTQRRLHYAPLQGETAERLLTVDQRDLDTVVFVTPKGTYTHSSAIARVLWTLGGFWAVMGTLLWLVPKPLRDIGYRVFASQRYRLFGKKETCRLPTQEEAGRILP